VFKILKISSAFIGIIVGAGFASGQEIFQYFTSFGYWGIAGAIFSAFLFAYLGMMLTRIGCKLQTDSHKEAIYAIGGKYIGFAIDAVLIFTFFGVGVVMIAGAGSTLHQQFGLSPFVGSLILTILIILSMLLKIDKVIGVIGSITPFLLIAIVIVSVYSLLTMDSSFQEMNAVTKELPDYFSNWFIAAVNYASFNIAVGAGMSLVMGGAEENARIASIGGFIGGLGIGVMMLLAHLAIFSRVDLVWSSDIPILKIFDEISPVLSTVMAFVLFGMIFNTGLSMFYGFVARFVDVENKRKNYRFIINTCVIGFVFSFIGFKVLVDKLYTVIGVAGLLLILALMFAPIKIKRDKLKKEKAA